MHIGRVLGCLLCALWWGMASALARAPQRLTATLDRTGAITVRFADSQRVYTIIRPGIFEASWQYRTTVSVLQPGAARIRAKSAGATINVTFEAALEATSERSLRIKYTLTPDKDLQVNSAHIAVRTPLEWWTNGKATLGTKEAAIEPQPSTQASLLVGEGSLELARQGQSLSLDAKDQPLLLQDNRLFGTPELEVRFGKQTQEVAGRLWAAGQTETFELQVSFPGPISLVREEPLILTAGGDWIALEETSPEILAGSALDFSSLLDAPAGKYGTLMATGGHFVFERGTKPQRFWGVTLSHTACYLEKPESDKLAERLARLGYNSVRLLRYDTETLTPAALDKLDYLVWALKQRGIYLQADLYSTRPIPETLALGNFKVAVLLSETAFGSWKDFTKTLLTHLNPYTKLAWKDEPALAWLSVIDEPNLTGSLASLKPELFALLEKEWQTWRKSRNLPPTPLPRQLNNDRAGREVGAFLTMLHERGFEKMKAFVRGLGCKALLTDLNGGTQTPALAAARMNLDYVDTHFLWDSPRFLDEPVQLPTASAREGASALGSGGAGPDMVAMDRLFGKPFTLSAFHYTAPNAYRAEGGLLVGAAAALQDWDGIWRTGYAQSKETVAATGPLDFFSLANDPASLASDRAAILLFLRGDLRPAPGAVSRHLRRDELLTKPEQVVSPGFGALALVTRVGTWIEDASGPLPPPRPVELRLTRGDSKEALAQLFQTSRLHETNKTNFDTDERQSETGEIFVNGQFGSIRVITPRTLGGVCPEGDAISCGPLRIQAEDANATVYVSSLDGKPVAESGRLLVAHITDLQNTGIRYGSSERKLLEDWGTLPHLVKNGSALLTLRRKVSGKVEAWRLDTSGKRREPLAATLKSTDLTLPLSTLGGDGKATIYYEVVIKGLTP